MRGIGVTLAAMSCVCLAAAQAAGTRPALAPRELVRKAVENEVKISASDINFMFRSRRQTPHGSQTKLYVQTRDAMAGIVIAYDDKPLPPGQRAAELARVERFVRDPDELRKKQEKEKEDSERTARIVKALPDAFLYEYAGTEKAQPGVGKAGDELVRLKFRPDPHYDPPSRVEQVLTGMSGELLIDAGNYRLARIDGTLFKDVSFGWGILGHLDKGGRFLVEQANVDGGWAMTRMKLHFTGKILLFKSLTIESTEVFSDFHRVPPTLTFAQGLEILKKEVESGSQPAQAGSSANRAAAPQR